MENEFNANETHHYDVTFVISKLLFVYKGYETHPISRYWVNFQ